MSDRVLYARPSSEGFNIGPPIGNGISPYGPTHEQWLLVHVTGNGWADVDQFPFAMAANG